MFLQVFIECRRRLHYEESYVKYFSENSSTALILSVQYHLTGAFTGGLSGFVEISPHQRHYPCPERCSPLTTSQSLSIVEPENLDFWTQISGICVPGNDCPHYPSTIVQLSLRPMLLAILLAITSVPKTDGPVTGAVVNTP